MSYLNETHDPSLRSWVESANVADNGFPIQNLPFATVRAGGPAENCRPGTGIGSKVPDLAALASANPFQGLAAQASSACSGSQLTGRMALTAEQWSALRLELS